MIYILTVLYNSNIKEVSNINNDIKFVYIDNSVDMQIKKNNVTFAEENKTKIIYIDMDGNRGLSKAYNKAINTITPQDRDYVIIFDQDTEFEDNIFEQYMNFTSNNSNIDIICPIVKDTVGIMSPCIRDGVYFKHIKTIDQVSNENIQDYSFINSGMCIKGSVFTKTQYDEKLFLDFVDHDFIKQVNFQRYKIRICYDIILYQNFSGTTINSFEQDFIRFKIFIKDAKVYYKKYFPYIYYKIFLLKRTIKLTILHKKSNFIKQLIIQR